MSIAAPDSSSSSGNTPPRPTRPAAGDSNDAFSGPTQEHSPPADLSPGAVLRNRYRIQYSLGKGGFGGVYLALDLDLNRQVAIKRQIGRHLQDTELARNEAKFIAGLDHPSIVRIYDLVDDQKDGVLIIMEYVSGFTLHELLRRKRLSIARAIELAADVTQALIHAHSRRIVHRDLKPSNVLLDASEKVKLTDFGLALGIINLETAPSAAGTPKYMAPEQVRGESHRIDGRTDLWSLGVMLYEMLCGTLPFSGPSRGATFEAILNDDPTPPRQLNPRIPEEVEHIVLRCLRKRMSERPASATDLLDDLKACQASATVLEAETGILPPGQVTALDPTDSKTPKGSSTSHGSPLRVEPKGLRPYSEEDGVYFLDLIPGPRERSGLPESIHFWKKWASCDNVDEYASVGVLYGPSGAGKTSFIRAGLVNQLDHDICPIVIECRKGDLASRLESAIRSRFRHKSQSGSLSKLLSGLREEEGAHGYRKILLILDQFESWSTSATTEERRCLADALRHCDGKTLQSLFVVRDDYWSGISEIMQWIDVPLVEQRNVRSLELLDPRHAQRVLEGMGRAHGILPRAPESLTLDQQGFIRQAIEGLAKNDRVVAVHLVMFSQICRVLPWTPQMLRKQGGVEGACSAYLHEIFETSSGPPAYRRLAGVVAEILSALLPTLGDPLKASAKSIDELRGRALGGAAAGKVSDAVRVLSEDLKLITPTRSEGDSDSGEESYQLAHDFLVEPVRNWVELARKSTWRGRAAARLVELSELWQRKPQAQFLPTLREYAAIQMVVPSSSRNDKQTKFLRAAGRYHAGKAAALTVSSVAAVFFAVMAIYQFANAAQAGQSKRFAEVSLFLHGPVSEVPHLLRTMSQDPRYLPIVNSLIENSDQPYIQVRGELLAKRLGKSTFASIAQALDDVEAELYGEILAGVDPAEAKAAVKLICSDAKTNRPLRVRAAILLLDLGDQSELEGLLSAKNVSESMQSDLIDVATTWRGPPAPWVKLLSSVEEDVQATAIAVLATYPTSAIDEPRNWRQIELLVNSKESQVGETARWLLGFHNQPVPANDITPPQDADWIVTPVQRLKMRKVEAGALQRWDHPLTHPESYEVALDHPLLVNTTMIDRRMYAQFLSEVPNYSDGSPIEELANNGNIVDADELRPERPAAGMRFDAVVEFCNWLSRKEGLTPFYQYDGKLVDGAIESSRQVPFVSRWKTISQPGGFRIPTEKEIHYLIMAGAEKGTPWNALQRIVLNRYHNLNKTIDESDRSATIFPPNRFALFVFDDRNLIWTTRPALAAASAGLHEMKIQTQSEITTAPSFENFILVVRDPDPSKEK